MFNKIAPVEGRDHRLGLNLNVPADRALVFNCDQMMKPIYVKIFEAPKLVLLIVPFSEGYFSMANLIDFSAVCQDEAARRFDTARYFSAHEVVNSIAADICLYRAEFINVFRD